MRRRRRHSTQASKPASPSAFYPASSKPVKKWKRYLLYFFSFCVIVLSAYYLYEKFYYPQAVQITKSAQKEQVSADMPTPRAEVEQEPVFTPIEKKVQVQILNGCGKEGVAKTFQTFLQEKGYDVLNTDNYLENGKRRWDLPESMVIDHTGHMDKAREIATALGISRQKVVSKPDPNTLYDLSVVIGRDYTLLKAVSRKKR